jgi:hypothetical protein
LSGWSFMRWQKMGGAQLETKLWKLRWMGARNVVKL